MTVDCQRRREQYQIYTYNSMKLVPLCVAIGRVAEAENECDGNGAEGTRECEHGDVGDGCRLCASSISSHLDPAGCACIIVTEIKRGRVRFIMYLSGRPRRLLRGRMR